MGHTPNTKSRLVVLERIAKKTRSACASLWLIDRSGGSVCARLSYATGPAAQKYSNLRNASLNIPSRSDWTDNGPDGGVSSELCSKFDSLIKSGIGESSSLSYYLVESEIVPNDSAHEIEALAILVLQDAEPNNRFQDSNLPDLLATTISSSRTRRVVSAVFDCQEQLKQSNGELERTLFRVAWQAKIEIGAERLFFYCDDVSDGWYELSQTNGEIRKSAFRDASVFDQAFGNDGEIRSGQTKPSEMLGEPTEYIVVPLAHSGKRLAKTKFEAIDRWSSNLEAADRDEFIFVFTNKKVEAYLQDIFSETDLQICNAIYRSIEPYASVKSQEENFAHLNRFFAHSYDSDVNDPVHLIDELSSISRNFKDVYVCSVESDQDMTLAIKSSANAPTLREDYIDRLKERYLAKFDFQYDFNQPGEIFVGLEKEEGAFLVEAHFPGNGFKSKIVLIRYAGSVISASLQRSLERLFHELQIRFRKNNNDVDRASSLVQIRHALIHQFTGAFRSLDSALKTWNLLAKHPNPKFWAAFKSDPIFVDLIPSAYFSLSQATGLIENGRFLIGEIDSSSLNRKKIDVVDLVNKAFKVMDYLKNEKGIVVIHKVTGSPPKTMNGDKVLMSIALLNLADNAIKFSFHDKKVTWQVDFGETSYTFSVSNVGNKIDEKSKNLIGKVGYRGRQKDRLNQRPGTGFGLPVTEKILQAHWPNAKLHHETVGPDANTGLYTTKFQFTMPYLTGKKDG